MTLTRPDKRRRVVIECITPEVDGGRFPAKRTVGDEVRVEADIFSDGHDAISASLIAHREGSEVWTQIPMHPLVNDRWTAAFRVSELGKYGFKVQGWVDHFETWRRDLLKRIKAESDTAVDYLIGADLVAEAAGRATGGDAGWLRERASVLRSGSEAKELRTHATDPLLHELVLRYPDKHLATESDHEIVVVVDPVRARFSSWYEFFPSSTAEEPGRHGTLRIAKSGSTMLRKWASTSSICLRSIPSEPPSARAATTRRRQRQEIAEVHGLSAWRTAGIRKFIQSWARLKTFDASLRGLRILISPSRST
jgi:starch synthase (maltosyl-transferring)